ncbi:MAG: sugar phosphate isomerase/epimerase [Thermoguttaceae bacterium]|nr:sugar phosphate isomerase/epimerase [Thermoguttaceae bacterium]MBQ3453327.1 sugar phosphate isomerase/epimerase [Thermoguttaceae bacterium]MBR2583910.1 sugar phosphate isomerase/epimerase [Thermoguttaceae bacterium]
MAYITRRQWLKSATLAAGACALGSFSLRAEEALYTGGAPNAEKLGWRIGVQLYSFHTITFQEAVQKAASIGLKWGEAYPGHKLAPDRDVTFGAMSEDDKKFVKNLLADYDFHLHGMGVGGYDRAAFEFAKDFGMETLICEPAVEDFDAIEELVKEYGINLSIHNHPKPSIYWDYHKVLEVCEGRDGRIGACVDDNHMVRSGIDPVEGIRALKGRIISFHFGDLDANKEDVPIGSGIANIPAIMKELKAQGFKGVFPIEFEKNPGQNLAEIAAGVKFADEYAKTLL